MFSLVTQTMGSRKPASDPDSLHLLPSQIAAGQACAHDLKPAPPNANPHTHFQALGVGQTQPKSLLRNGLAFPEKG